MSRGWVSSHDDRSRPAGSDDGLSTDVKELSGRNEQPVAVQLTAVMDDASVSAGVRLVAASHSLGWHPEKAVAVLAVVVSEAGRVGGKNRGNYCGV
jgi:hypothetical protein